MKNIFKKSILAWLMVAASYAYAIPSVDKPAPDFSVITAGGKTVKLSDYKGKTVVLEWTNASCPFVKKHYSKGNMQNLQAKHTKNGVVWLSVVSSAEGKQGYVTPGEAKKLTADRKATPTEVLLDAKGDLGKLYGAKTTPHMYVIDDKGVLRYMGAIDSIRSADSDDIAAAINYVDNAVMALASGKIVEKPVTSPYGCSVKY